MNFAMFLSVFAFYLTLSILAAWGVVTVFIYFELESPISILAVMAGVLLVAYGAFHEARRFFRWAMRPRPWSTS